MSEEINATGGDLEGGPDGQGGEGTTGTPTDYAGFETPEALIDAYQGATAQTETLQEQIANLERIKGGQGNELGQLRNQVATLTGQLEGMQKAMPANTGPSLDDIAKSLNDGKIDEVMAIRQAAQLTEQQVKTTLGQEFKEMLDSEVGTLKEQMEKKEYIRDFLSKNPGYKEAHEGGKLQPWLSQGMSGEDAWMNYRLQAQASEIEALKKKAEVSEQKGKAAGVDQGIKIEKSKIAAGKVLTGKGGQFSQTSGNGDMTNPNERRQAGIALLQKMRSSA